MRPGQTLRIAAILSLWLSFHLGTASADVIYVPDDYPTIQAAIDAASNDDVISVAAGTYSGEGNRDIDFRGKSLEVVAPAGPEATLIDCENQGHGFIAMPDEPHQAVIDGFKIIHGSATQDSYIPEGGAITTWNAIPIIRNCVIEDCWAASSGGGIYISNVPGGWTATIADCTVRDCAAGTGEHESSGIGGGIAIVYGRSVELLRCSITGNSVTDGNNSYGWGGGIYIAGETWTTFEDCMISGNLSRGNGGGILLGGGGASFDNCLITKNGSYLGGAGIEISSASVTFTATTIASNQDEDYFPNDPATGGVFCRGPSSVILERTILWDNCTEGDYEEALLEAESEITFLCCDVDAPGVGGDGTVTYLDDNLFVDPLFCEPVRCDDYPIPDGDFALDANSPCLPGASPCGELIGALGEGCGEPVAVEVTTLGRIKGLFR